jgi:hypothetical protein
VPRLRLGLALAALLGAATYLALGTGPFMRWLAAALLVTLLELRPWTRVPPRLHLAVPHLALGILVLVLLGEFLLGRPPATRDHAIHYFQVELLVHDLLPAGHLSGWSDRLGNGYTFGDSYPVLGYLWMGAAHLLTLGLVPLRASYALGVFAMWLLAVGGVWRLAACITAELLPRSSPSNDGQKIPTDRPAVAELGAAPRDPSTSTAPPAVAELGADRLWPAWAGCLGAAFWLLDVGASREGGWEYLMFHGVWPQLLAIALWIWALPATLAAVRNPSPRRIALAGGLHGLAILAHPFALLTVACSAGAWLLLFILRPDSPDLPRVGRWRVFLLVHALAALLAVGWLASFLASADSMGRSPVPWLSWGELATQLLAGELFVAHRAWVGPLAVIGLGLALRRGAALAWLTAGLLLATLVLASDAAVTVLRLDLLSSAFKNVQFPRYAIVLKPLWYALAGVGAAIVMLWARRSRDLHQSPTPGQPSPAPALSVPKKLPTNSQNKLLNLPRWTACILLAPILSGALDDLSRLLPGPVGARHTLEASHWGSVEADLHAALISERAATPRPLKIAFLRTGMGGGTFPMFAIADEHADLVLDGHIPSLNSVHRIRGRTLAMLRGLGVTHVLYDKKLRKAEQQLADALTPVVTAGPYTLARLAQVANPRQIPGVASWTARDLTVTATRHDAHALDLDVSAAAPIHLLATPDRKWHATFIPAAGGEPVALDMPTAALFSNDLNGTRITVPAAGRVELRYVDPPRERGLAWLSLAAALATLAALAFGRPLQFAERLHSPTARKISVGLTAVTVALLVLLAVRRQSNQLARTWEPLVAPATFVADLVDRGAYRVKLHPSNTCDGLGGRDARHGCTPARDRPRRATYYRDPYLYRCLWITVPPRGSADVRFDPPPGTRVVGQFKRRTPGGKPGKRLTYKIGRSRPAPLKERAEPLAAAALTFNNGSADSEQVCIIAAAVAD